MRKMMLLATTVALATMMLAAAPAFAQPVTEINGFRFSPGNCGNLEGTTLTREEAVELLEEEGLDPDELPDAGNVCLLDENGNGNGNGNGDDDDDDDDDRDFRNLCRFFDCRDNDDNNNNNVVPAFEITQDFEQEAESGDVDQSFDVSQTGDNSNQTAGIQGVANTGNAQNAIGVIDAGGFVGDFNGDRFDDDNDFFDDGRLICRDDNHNGDDEECRFVDDFFGDNDNDFCDDNHNGDDEECFFVDGFFGDNDNDFFNDDDFIVHGVGDGGDIDIEDSGASIDLSPTNTTTSSQQVNQAAAASGDGHHWWR